MKIGDIFQIPKPPILNHWPSASSRKYIGKAAKTAVHRYGIRKAPERNMTRGINMCYKEINNEINNENHDDRIARVTQSGVFMASNPKVLESLGFKEDSKKYLVNSERPTVFRGIPRFRISALHTEDVNE